jgi:hypothetical protein
MGPPLTIDELVIADPPAAWRAAGFRVEGDLCVVGGVRLRLVGPGPARGVVGWSVRGLPTLDVDGLPTTASDDPSPPVAANPHPNGVTAIDHVVVLTPDIARTTATLRDAGFDLRHEREGPTPGGAARQSFFTPPPRSTTSSASRGRRCSPAAGSPRCARRPASGRRSRS